MGLLAGGARRLGPAARQGGAKLSAGPPDCGAGRPDSRAAGAVDRTGVPGTGERATSGAYDDGAVDLTGVPGTGALRCRTTRVVEATVAANVRSRVWPWRAGLEGTAP